MSFWKWLASAAWLRFVAFGALLFGLHAAYGDAPPDRIVLTAAQRRQLEEGFATERGRAPTAAEREALVEQWASDEALLRHARALGLDDSDQVVRRRLIQDVELLLEAEAEPVDEAAVRARYEAQRERFREPAVRSFRHVFVSGTTPKAQARARAVHAALCDGASPSGAGDPSGHGSELSGVSQRRLSARLGSAVGEAAYQLSAGEWSEPLRSELGYHLLRVESERPARTVPFERVQAQLRAELEAEARAKALQQGRRALRRAYALEQRP